jgi:hypothetical protein
VDAVSGAVSSRLLVTHSMKTDHFCMVRPPGSRHGHQSLFKMWTWLQLCAICCCLLSKGVLKSMQYNMLLLRCVECSEPAVFQLLCQR